jgi:hypothetical protein
MEEPINKLIVRAKNDYRVHIYADELHLALPIETAKRLARELEAESTVAEFKKTMRF